MRRIFCGVLAVSLSACSWGPWPIPPKYNRDIKSEDARNNSQAIRALTVESARGIAKDWTDSLHNAGTARRNTNIIVSEVLYYGTIMTVFGAAAVSKDGIANASKGAIRLRNTGAGLTTAATLFNSRYQPDVQQQAFKKAAALMQCALDSVAPIDPQVYERFDPEQFAQQKLNGVSAEALYQAVPKQLIEFIEQISIPALEADLEQIPTVAPTTEEIAQVYQKWQIDRDTVGKDAPTAHVQALNDDLKTAMVTVAKSAGHSPTTVYSAEMLDTAKVAPLTRSVMQGKSSSQINAEGIAFMNALGNFSNALTVCKTKYLSAK